MMRTSRMERFVSHLRTLFLRVTHLPNSDLSKSITPFIIVGLAALYASGYFLLPLTPVRSYLLPSHDLFHLIVVPSIVAAATVGTGIFVASLVARKIFSWRTYAFTLFLGVSFFAVLGLNGILQAAGYEWQDLVPLGHDLAGSQHNFKVLTICVVCALVWVARKSLPALARLLSSLGFAFVILATIRIFLLWQENISNLAIKSSQVIEAPKSTPAGKSRRVIWIIFDELDYGRIFGDSDSALPHAHFNWLASRSVHATNANSPASATLYSVPSLVSGVPLGGNGVRIVKPASLVMDSTDASSVTLKQETTIFGSLEASGHTVSILGFYHPYCKLFEVQRCVSYSYYELGGTWTGLLANLPDRVASRILNGDIMERITARSLEMLPVFIARDDELTFVHLNVPHLPAFFADKRFHVSSSGDGALEYTRNLALADEILGTVIADVQQQASRHELLLVVSSDHWFRNIWFQPTVKEISRPIPFMAWRVGDTRGIEMNEPISTVNTAAMVMEFLRGRITSQSDIAVWWASQHVHPSFIVKR